MKKILLVDDHADIRRLMRITLGQAYDIFEAEDGVKGLALVHGERPDLVLLDIMMPGDFDGLQVLDEIRADPGFNAMKVIMVSAKGQALDREAGMRRGADAYFVKPFSPLELKALIAELLAK